MKWIISAAALAMAGTALGGCGGSADSGNNAANALVDVPEKANLYDVLDGASGLDTASDLSKQSGLEDVLKGVGPYTLFLPNDDAFKAAGDLSSSLEGDDQRAQRVAFLTAYIVPGYITLNDIQSAVASANGKPVEMTTMAGGKLTFARDAGGAITVTGDGGSTAKLSSDEELASNGAIHGIDTVLATKSSESETE